MTTTEHHYPRRGLVGDYLRAGVGTILTATPFFAVDLGPVARVFVGSGVMLFTVYGILTWHRQRTTVRASEQGVLVDGLMKNYVAWDHLDLVRLNYYSTRRESRSGWMQLILKGAGQRVKIDSSLEGFEEIVARAAAAADRHGLSLSEATLENLRSLGLRPEAAASREERT